MDSSYHPTSNGMESQRSLQTKHSRKPNVKLWKKNLKEFTETTTLHGLRYISLKNAFVVRRLFWLLLLLACTGLFVVQIVDRILYYYESPVTVNFKVNYNRTLLFPAITICNQNSFRATSASDKGRYRLIERMYNGSILDDERWLVELNATHLPLDEVFLDNAHRKEDVIISCYWGEEPCGPDNFSTVLTDHGVCYTFNKPADHRDILNVSSTGSEHGLRLTLNVENYESMPGPHDANGIKILAGDHAEFPRVHEIGMAIPTGSHAFMGLRVLQVTNLPEPHGECGHVTLDYFRQYSVESCELETVTKEIIKHCGCRHFYMPNIGGNIPVCTLAQYYGCYLKAFDNQRRSSFQCPTACRSLIFDPDVSYASTSLHAKDKIITESTSEDLAERFYRAREVKQRMDENTMTRFKNDVGDTTRAYEKLNTLLVEDLNEKITTQLNDLRSIERQYSKVMHSKMFLYRFQEYVIQKNFMRGRDAMEERTLTGLCLGFHEFVFNIETKLKLIVEFGKKDHEAVHTFYTLALNDLDGKMATATRALDNFTELYHSYETGDPIFNYKFSLMSRKNNKAIVPRQLLKRALTHNSYARNYSPRVGQNIRRIMAAVDEYKNLTSSLYSTKELNVTEMSAVSQEYIDACEDFFWSKSQFYFEVIDYPLKIMQNRISAFEYKRTSFADVMKESRDHLKNLNESLQSIREDFLQRLDDAILFANEYLSNTSVQKSALSKMFLTKNIVEGVSVMKTFFQEVRRRGQFLYDTVPKMILKGTQIWDKIINDEDMIEYYLYKNRTDLLRNFTVVVEELNMNFTRMRDETDFRFLVGSTDEEFIRALNHLTHELSAFEKGNQLDSEFIRQNFLQLDIFYRELSYEEIKQQVAYDIFALLCDIGGSMGLFLGASAMTLFEIIDFVMNQCAEWAIRKPTSSRW